MATTNNESINTFIIESVLIQPIEKILNMIKNKEIRDCDIKWLDGKMKQFIVFAGETLNIKAPVMSETEVFTIYNPYVQNYYTERFTTLLNYFKSFN